MKKNTNPKVSGLLARILKASTAVLLSILLLVASNATSLASVFFEVSRTEIATELCVKKDIKENDCQGMCQLRRILEEKEDAKNSPFFQYNNSMPEATLNEPPTAMIFLKLAKIFSVHRIDDEEDYISVLRRPPRRV